MKYAVEITEMLSRRLEIEAESPEKAFETVRDAYRNFDIVLGSEDFLNVEMTVLPVVLKLN